MQSSLFKYRPGIQSGKMQAHVRWDGKASATIFDAADPTVPLDYMSFGVYRLEEGPFELSSADREFVFMPVEGEYDFRIADHHYTGSRAGGPFATLPEKSNASAVYVGRDQTAKLSGNGVMIWFAAPANGVKPAAFVAPGQIEQVSRGKGVWHREVITLAGTSDLSTNLIAGETYSPPGLWSGTPLHTHDKDEPHKGEADLEEIYFHVARNTDGQWGSYAVQLLFDSEGMNQAYLLHNYDAIAIPGGAHPVVAGPTSDVLYFWALASSKPTDLKMKDVPEFGYLHGVAAILDALEQERGRTPVKAERLARMADEQKLDDSGREMLRQHLMERGFRIEY